jgi:glycosyltransferase involved in cell wall biosynthesis
MKICFLVDARSLIAQNWIKYFISRDHVVDVISTYPFSAESLDGASLYTVPVAFSGLARVPHNGKVSAHKQNSWLKSLLAQMRTGRASALTKRMHHLIGPVDVYRHVPEVARLIGKIRPDVVHAMRMPYEGIIAGLSVKDVPLIISTWGNDLTLFATSYPAIGKLTRRTLARADALFCDCQRDLRLARVWGFDEAKPATMFPGNGGVKRKVFHRGALDEDVLKRYSLPADRVFILNPRGFRDYIRNDTFFRALPLILKERPDSFFLAVAMEGNAVAEKWLKEYQVGDHVRLLPSVSSAVMAELFRLSAVSVSPSTHDGTPNTLLEAMACGSFPVTGDLESLREWITDGVNGLLCDPSEPKSLAAAVIAAINDEGLRSRAADVNRQLIEDRADYPKVMGQAEEFYRQVIGKGGRKKAYASA